MNDPIKEERANYFFKLNSLEQAPSEYGKYLKFGISIVKNLSTFYEKAHINIKHRLLGSIFPEKLIFENGVYRTNKPNNFLELFYQKTNGLEKEKADTSVGSSTFALPVGLEPTTL